MLNGVFHEIFLKCVNSPNREYNLRLVSIFCRASSVFLYDKHTVSWPHIFVDYFLILRMVIGHANDKITSLATGVNLGLY